LTHLTPLSLTLHQINDCLCAIVQYAYVIVKYIQHAIDILHQQKKIASTCTQQSKREIVNVSFCVHCEVQSYMTWAFLHSSYANGLFPRSV